MIHTRFIYRQITSSWKQTAVFIACVALSLVTLVSLGGFGESVNNSLLRDARKLLAADVEARSRFPFTDAVEAELSTLAAEPGIEIARTYEFISVVRQTDGEATLLSELKVVEPGYPFYGEVGLASKRPFAQVLTPGHIIVGQNLLDRLGLQVGDPLNVGQATLTIADVVVSEPDEPVNFFTLGPRIFIAAADLPTIDLIKPGSRVTYRALLRVADEGQVDGVAERLTATGENRQLRVDTFRTNQSGVQRFFENLLTFLNLIGIFTLMLAGIGIQSSLTAFLKEREETIAVLRTFGATSRFVINQFFAVAAVLGAIGTVLGLLLGLLLQILFPVIFAPFLPPQVEFVLSLRALLEGMILGLFVTAAFTFIPLYQIQELKPSFIFRKEAPPLPKSWFYYAILTLILAFFAGMVFWYLQNPRRTAYFAAGTVGLVAITAGLTQLLLHWLRRRRLKPLAPRQALRGLFRPRNATAAIIVTLTTSLAVLFTIYLIQRNLDASFVAAYPDNAPNLLILDIQPNQRQEVAAELGVPTVFYPVIRARIQSINGQEIQPREENNDERGNNDNNDSPPLDFPFSLTYQNDLLADETLREGSSLFDPADLGVAQVSVSELMLGSYPFKLGDEMVFTIQGVELPARVVSIRTMPGEENGRFAPTFNFVLREQDLINAPQTIITSVNIPPATIPALQNRLVNTFPNLTVVDITSAINTLAELVGNITVVIRFFTLFSIVAGVLIIISSVLATRFARIQEAVYFKVLGATRRFVLRVFALENIFIGLLSAILALFLSQLAGWVLVTQVFELSSYAPYLGASLLLMLLTVGLVTAVGLLASLSILRQKPITFLREQTVE
ncbi:MAG: FtsX-like permease family protein [Ardenticatenaceae bacterium]|nr:FtsX-like permease family protein [Ardenticatenaceae bacterium]